MEYNLVMLSDTLTPPQQRLVRFMQQTDATLVRSLASPIYAQTYFADPRIERLWQRGHGQKIFSTLIDALVKKRVLKRDHCHKRREVFSLAEAFQIEWHKAERRVIVIRVRESCRECGRLRRSVWDVAREIAGGDGDGE